MNLSLSIHIRHHASSTTASPTTFLPYLSNLDSSTGHFQLIIRDLEPGILPLELLGPENRSKTYLNATVFFISFIHFSMEF